LGGSVAALDYQRPIAPFRTRSAFPVNDVDLRGGMT